MANFDNRGMELKGFSSRWLNKIEFLSDILGLASELPRYSWGRNILLGSA